MTRQTPSRTGVLLVCLVCLLCATTFGVVPHRWRAQSEADFNTGDHKDAAATSRGELILAREVKVLMPSTDAPTVVSAVEARLFQMPTNCLVSVVAFAPAATAAS